MAVKETTAAEFAKINFEKVTLVDTREPDELIVSSIPGAINAPFSGFPKGLDDIPRDKPVYIYCRTGDFSGEVAEILDERGYDVTNVTDGYDAYRKLIESCDNGASVKVDAKGLKCPGPIVKVADTLRDATDGTVLEVEATEDAFASDIKIWCERTGNTLITLDAGSDVIYAKIKKTESS